MKINLLVASSLLVFAAQANAFGITIWDTVVPGVTAFQQDLDHDGIGDGIVSCGLPAGEDLEAINLYSNPLEKNVVLGRVLSCDDIINIDHDNCPTIPNPDQSDIDKDGIGDLCDPVDDGLAIDTDGDGVSNLLDVFPLDPTESQDSDGDGVGDNLDVFPADPDKDALTYALLFPISETGSNSNFHCLPDIFTEATLSYFGFSHTNSSNTPLLMPAIILGKRNLVQTTTGLYGEDCRLASSASSLRPANDGSLLFHVDLSVFSYHHALDEKEKIGDFPSVIKIQGLYPELDADCDGTTNFEDTFPFDAGNDELEDNNANTCDGDQDGVVNALDVFPHNPQYSSDNDFDKVAIDFDNCPNTSNYLQHDNDNDGIGNACDDDIDGDGSPNVTDPAYLNPTIAGDRDGDGVDEASDNCPDLSNVSQDDFDNDGSGDACDSDDDNDGYDDLSDLFPFDPGMAGDLDGDGFDELSDNCPGVANPDQADTLGDGIGNACDPDVDDDGFDDGIDVYPLDSTKAGDLDGDGVDEVTDNCPGIMNPDQNDVDNDGIGDICDLDMDGDGLFVVDDDDDDGDGLNDLNDVEPLNPYVSSDNDGDGVDWTIDNCRQVSNYLQSDIDSDGIGDACDDDIDGDGVVNAVDQHPLNPLASGDLDGDWVDDVSDNCIDIPNPLQSDLDSDGIGNACDLDIDGDGTDDVYDQFPLNANLAFDLDKDLIDDSVDPDIGFDVLKFDIGGHHGCGIHSKGVFCWGYNNYGQTTVPAGLASATEVSAGRYHSCAIANGSVTCWGDNTYGQLNVPALVNPVKISSGYFHTCAIDDAGVQCWGRNHYGQVSNVPPMSLVTEITSGPHHNCAVSQAGVSCWGLDDQGQSSAVPALTNPHGLAAAYKHTCVLDDSGVQCWGQDASWTTPYYGLANPQNLALISQTSCAQDGGDVLCWGNNKSYYEQNGFYNLGYTDIDGAIGALCGLNYDGLKCWYEDSFYGQMMSINQYRDFDADNDGVNNATDNCLTVSNYLQHDNDSDGIGNACDNDWDGDGVDNVSDNYPWNGVLQ